jgi:formylmethanofuran dehydrogenase subunit A
VRLAEYFNAYPNLTCDAGAVLFGNAVTITADGPWQHLCTSSRPQVGNSRRNETLRDRPVYHKGSNSITAMGRRIGTAPLITDLRRIFLTTDHPTRASHTPKSSTC